MLRQSSNSLLRAKPVLIGSSKQARSFSSGIRLMEEDTAAASQKLNADFASALRRAIAGQQKGKTSDEKKNKSSEQKVSKDRAERGQASLRRTRPRLFNKKGGDLPTMRRVLRLAFKVVHIVAYFRKALSLLR